MNVLQQTNISATQLQSELNQLGILWTSEKFVKYASVQISELVSKAERFSATQYSEFLYNKQQEAIALLKKYQAEKNEAKKSLWGLTYNIYLLAEEIVYEGLRYENCIAKVVG